MLEKAAVDRSDLIASPTQPKDEAAAAAASISMATQKGVYSGVQIGAGCWWWWCRWW